MEFGASKSPFDCLLLDLDDTLYSSKIGIGQACKKNIEEFLAMKCGVSEEEAFSLRVELFKSYGSSFAGLIDLGYDVHPDEYHSFVHGRLPYERIEPDGELRALLLSVPQPKILFTNSDRQHARRALQRLGIEEGCFERIICFETMNPHLFDGSAGGGATDEDEDDDDDDDNDERSLPSPPTPGAHEVILKPSPAAMKAAVCLSGFAPHRMLFLDDSERNIAAGKAIGLHTALVGKREKTKEADYALESISSLRQVVPQIWGEKEKNKKKDGDHGRATAAMRHELDSRREATPIGA